MDQELTFEMQLDGEQVTCTVLFTFSSDETGADYILYTPDDPSAPEVRLMAGRYDPNNIRAIYPLQDDRDRTIVQNVIDYVTAQEQENFTEEADDGIFTVEDLPC